MRLPAPKLWHGQRAPLEVTEFIAMAECQTNPTVFVRSQLPRIFPLVFYQRAICGLSWPPWSGLMNPKRFSLSQRTTTPVSWQTNTGKTIGWTSAVQMLIWRSHECGSGRNILHDFKCFPPNSNQLKIWTWPFQTLVHCDLWRSSKKSPEYSLVGRRPQKSILVLRVAECYPLASANHSLIAWTLHDIAIILPWNYISVSLQAARHIQAPTWKTLKNNVIPASSSPKFK